MAANVQPIFPLIPKIGMGTLTTANTAKDGTGAVTTVLTANPSGNGLRVDSIKLKANGTNVATVLRLFINNGNPNSTPSNNILFVEISLPATTLTEVAATTDISITFNDILYGQGVTNAFPQLVLPVGYKINAVIGTAVAAGWQIAGVSGEY